MDELEELDDELFVEELLLDTELDSDDVDEELDSVLLVLTECDELESVETLLSVLLDRLLSLRLDVLAEDVLLELSVLVEELDRVDWLDSDMVWLLLLVEIDCELLVVDELLLVLIVWLDDELELVETVDSDDGLLDESVLSVEMLDCGELLELLLLLDDRLLLESVLVERLDAVLALLLELETLEVLEVLRLDSVLDESVLDDRLLSVDDESVDVLDELSVEDEDEESSSTAMIRRSCAISDPCCWPL